MNKKGKVIGIIFVIILILIVASLTGRRVGKLLTAEQDPEMQQLEKGIYYHVYDYDWKKQEGSMLVKIADPDNGIDTVTCPDGMIINCYGKTQVGIDYQIQNEHTYSFIATTNTAETIQQDITINQETIQDLITFDVQEEHTNLTINIDYHQYENKYYKFHEDGEWIAYQGEFSILAEDVVEQGGYEEETKTSIIYLKGVDDVGNEVIIQKKIPIKAEMPKVNLIFRNAVMEADINAMKQNIKDELAKHNISAGLMEIALGGEEVIQSNKDDAQTIFNTWGRVGYTGRWYYDDSSKSIINSENTNNFTGFYYAKRMDYDEIELEFNNMSTDSDDDMMGCMIRFNRNSNGTVTTYLFALDKHDNGGGINYGAYNGLLKITGRSFAFGNVTLLQRVNRVWSRNTWTNYKITAKDNNIKVYMDGQLVIDYTDNESPILSGSYGFFSYSQAYSMYKDIKGKGLKYYSLSEAIDITQWDKDTNCIININNETEEGLTDEVANKLQANNIHYIGVTTEEHKQEVNEFLPKNMNKGTYVNSADYEQAAKDVVAYVMSIL